MDSKITVSGQLTKTINFAMQQNYVPVLRNLIVTNQTEETYRDLILRISFEPAFAKAYEYRIDLLEKGASTEISPVHIVMSPDYLLSLTERVVGNIHVTVSHAQTVSQVQADGALADGALTEETLADQVLEIELLSYDEWSGLNRMPEMVSAFVTPNHPAVTEIIASAGKYMMAWVQDPSFTGYQRQNPNIVRMQMAAIYAALQTQNITYCMPPASYETIGQKIRLPQTVLEQKMGTCLDLSILYAACLEAVGLHPVLIFIKGHCFAGAWMEENTFPDCVIDDPGSITKRIVPGIEQLTLIECTDFVVGKSVDFERAQKHAKDHLADPAEFELAIDVMRSRGGGIRPIPTRIMNQGKFEAADYGKREASEVTGAPAWSDTQKAVAPQEEQMTKERLWERKLLDLSLRNTLLSFRATRSAVQLMVANLSVVEDELTKGESFKIMSRPNDWADPMKDTKIFEIETEQDLINTIAEAEFKSKRIRTFLTEQELEKNMKFLQRQAKQSMEENGSNTLYLAMGFLRWYETDLSEKARYAPLILVPVDIVKKIQDKAYSIRIRDDETQVNITLLELLRQDYGIQIKGLDPLPADENGVDVPLILNTFRQAVLEKKRWDVEEWSFIGLFSFSRFIMWNDLRNRSEDLKKNKVVASLMKGEMTWTPEELSLDAAALDEGLMPSEMAVPMSADASQLIAVCNAAKGQSFVLHGPPGTGKSQTITNMIANALYQGKSVLFVAEKMAALTVVEKRLGKIGLDPFCLELHSNKAQKRAVLEQLDHTLHVARVREPREYEQTAAKLHELRVKLDSFVKAMHAEREYGKSVRELVAIYEKYADLKGYLTMTDQQIASMNQDSYDQWKEMLGEFCVALKECGSIQNHPLRYVRQSEYSMEYRERLSEEVREFGERSKSWKEVYIKLNTLFNEKEGDQISTGVGNSTESEKVTYERLVGLVTVSNVMSTAKIILPGVIANAKLEEQDGLIRQLLDYGQSVSQQYAMFLNEFYPALMQYPVEDALMRYRQAESSWALGKTMAQNKLLKELRALTKNPATMTKERIPVLLESLQNYYVKVNYIAQASAVVTGQLGSLWQGIQTNWKALLEAYEASVAIRTVLLRIAGTPENYQSMTDAINRIVAMPVPMQESSKTLFAEYERAAKECLEAEAGLLKMGIQTQLLRNTGNWFGAANSMVEEIQNGIGNLKEWTIYLKLSEQVKNAGFSNIAEAVSEDLIPMEQIIPAYEANLCHKLIMSTIKKDPALADFQGAQFENSIARLRQTDEEFSRLTIAELQAKLSAQIPQSGTFANSSEIGILQKAIKSGGRMQSIRKLFDSIPTLLRRMCPCMLMSPISVAQYIDPSFDKFDLVIFDEASQLPTSEAVGAIARGENVIVVGDPKQLPPTSFFAANQFDEENYSLEDMESVLDDCLALSMPQEHLLWHYRSRHESLIAYSNAKYYENKLYTFPSPNDLVSEVKYVQVEGFYDKGGSRQNRAEAEAIVQEIVRRLTDAKLCRNSIGVVTFSIVQQNLIDDLLSEEFHKNPELEQISEATGEPVIIKNLENVQGDERDVILFSIGYGPDENGKITMNFGPLNNDGGWRRLNVAITRARKEMIVFATIKPEQIDLNRTSSEGVAGLKGFLEFASYGRNSLVTRNQDQVHHSSELEEMIAESIREKGYEVKCRIGFSAYKVDIGIVDPENPEEYILGLMCDGDSYRLAQTARDRNILQPDVLAGLGWNLMHVWTLDWIDNQEKVLDQIINRIEQIQADRKKAEQEEKQAEQQEEKRPEQQEEKQAEQQEEKQPEKDNVEEKQAEEESTESFADSQQDSQDSLPIYVSAHILQQGSPEEFYLDATMSKRRTLMKSMIELEAPISRKLLCRKVMNAWGITRSGTKVEAILNADLQNIRPICTLSNGTDFYWKNGQNSEQYAEFRVPSEEENKRTMDDIAAEEIATAIRYIMERQLGMSKTDLIRETAKLFGYSKIGSIIDISVIRGILEAKRRGYIELSEDGERVTICE